MLAGYGKTRERFDFADLPDHQRIEIRRIGDVVDLTLFAGTDPADRASSVAYRLLRGSPPTSTGS
ncbi:MAG TPA: hypothetical protein DEQ98_02425 [Acidobacteria bacterium]|nr:hypothetical protein [Acidobacteriota bacterium]